VRYSPADIGEIGNVFDQSDESLMRGLNANPLVLDLEFAQPRSLSAINLVLAAMPHAQVTVKLTGADGQTTTFVRDYLDLEGIPVLDLPIPSGPLVVSGIRVEIMDLAPQPEDGPHIHVRELRLR
jgi:hypothetical protein